MRIDFPTIFRNRSRSYRSYLKTLTWRNTQKDGSALTETEWDNLRLVYGDVMGAFVRRYERFLWRRGDIRELLPVGKTDRKFFYVTAYDVYPGTVKTNLRNLQTLARDGTLDSYSTGSKQYFTLTYSDHRELVTELTRLHKERQSFSIQPDFLGTPTQTELVLNGIRQWWQSRVAK